MNRQNDAIAADAGDVAASLRVAGAFAFAEVAGHVDMPSALRDAFRTIGADSLLANVSANFDRLISGAPIDLAFRSEASDVRALRLRGEMDQLEAELCRHRQESALGRQRRIAAAQSLVRKFDRLRRTWETETEFVSSLEDMVLHPCYQQIIGLGPSVVPLLINELRERPNQWFWALGAITGADPVPDESAGDFDAHVQHWLRWADNHGFSARGR